MYRHVNVFFKTEDVQKMHELFSLVNWTCRYMYNEAELVQSSPYELGKLKCCDIYLHFLELKHELLKPFQGVMKKNNIKKFTGLCIDFDSMNKRILKSSRGFTQKHRMLIDEK